VAFPDAEHEHVAPNPQSIGPHSVLPEHSTVHPRGHSRSRQSCEHANVHVYPVGHLTPPLQSLVFEQLIEQLLAVVLQPPLQALGQLASTQ